MKYEKITTGTFLERPNRFVAHVLIGGEMHICHVKNTGRCKELLIPGAKVVLSEGANPSRKTKYDLIAVWKGDMLVNMDSQAPNKVFGEWAMNTPFPENLTLLRPESTWGKSRFDFYYEAGDEKGYIEVKGVTLERGGVCAFPDAPTTRGARHIRELIEVKKAGMGAHLAFVIQMPGMKYLELNYKTDPDFARAMEDANREGVNIIALECSVTENTLEICGKIPVHLSI